MSNKELEKEFEARVYTDADGNTMPYRLLMPEKYDASKKYPLVLFLHGAAERGDDNDSQLANGVLNFATKRNRELYPCFVVAPQCPANSAWVDIWNDILSEPMRMVFEILQALQKEFSIDQRRRYITGISMGGFATWDTIERMPGYFAAAVPVCGGGDTSSAYRIVHLPVWAFHGEDDQIVSVQYSRDMIASIKKAGGNPKYTEYPGVGHASWNYAYKDPELYEWLFSQEKKTAEKKT